MKKKKKVSSHKLDLLKTYQCPGEFHGLYSPWGHKESDTTEQLSFLLYQ